MSTLARNVEFLSKSKHEKKKGGFEAGVAPKAPEPAAPPSAEQLARITDLFIHGVISPDQAAKARASRGGFEVMREFSRLKNVVIDYSGAMQDPFVIRLR